MQPGHSSGSKYRRDYILTSKAAFELVTRTQVLKDFDTTFCHDDHVPLWLQVQGMLQSDASTSSTVQWDEQAFLCPDRIAAFRQALATLPIPTWQMDVADHKNWYQRQLYQLGVQFFAKRTRPRLNRDTLDAIAFKRHLLDCARHRGIAQSPEFKDIIKPIEKTIRAKVKTDLNCFYGQLLVQLQEAGSLGDQKTVFRTLTKLRGRNRKLGTSVRPLPMLKKPDGTLAQTFQQRQQVWMEQFAAIKAGHSLPVKALQHKDAQLGCEILDLPQPESFRAVWTFRLACAS